ncbi:MAG: hypothetical protein Phyf2KO_00500 [Phycisphaerales bacterium]
MKIFAAGAMLLAGGAGAQQIYATNILAPTGDNSDELVVYDASNPSGYTVIGSTGVAGIGFGGLEFTPNGNMFGYASLFKATGGAASGLYSIDTNTGAATLIGDSGQTMQDLAYNPVDSKMYGVNTRFGEQTTIFEVDLTTGATTDLGLISGLPAEHHIGGLAIDANGEFVVHDILSDAIYKGDGSSFSLLYSLADDTSFQQGMTIDWSRDNKGYHASVGFGVFPDYFSLTNTFELDGSDYTVGLPFGPNDMDGIPPVQPGDIAIRPVPAPASGLVVAALGGFVTRRRRS